MMKELENILREQAKRYPEMQPEDAVKLIYQNEFGGGHLIRNEAACLQYLREEYAQVRHDAHADLWEYIGNGIYRVNLAALEAAQVETLGQAFIRSANAHKGSMANFLSKLSLLQALTQSGVFAFDAQALETYLKQYEMLGYPAVSHSEAYRKAYHPAYRVVKK